MASVSPSRLLRAAREGDNDALGTLLEKYRSYLRLLAQRKLDTRLATRVDPSDIVQLTFLEAQRDLPKFRGSSEGELVAWMRAILEHNVAHSLQRHVITQKRSTNRERRLDEKMARGPDGSGATLASVLPADQSSPSQRAMRGEAAIRLAQALDVLPENQREAVRLRHIEGWPLAQIATHFSRSEVAVAGLIKRGLQGLRQQFSAGDS